MTEERLRLWRNTFHLFCRYNKPSFVGPFAAAEYTSYKFESKLLERNTGKIKKPDIITTSKTGDWAILDMTLWDGDDSKSSQLSSYLNLNQKLLSVHGFEVPTVDKPDVILSRLIQDIDITEFCQIIVDDKFKCYNPERIACQNLREQLIQFKGTDFSNCPQIAVSLLPEMQIPEIKVGLISIIKKILNPNSKGVTIEQMCEEGLDKLYEHTSIEGISDLCNKIELSMNDLMKKTNLKDYIQYDGEKYIVTDKGKKASTD